MSSRGKVRIPAKSRRYEEILADEEDGFHCRKKQYAGRGVGEIRQLKQGEMENRQLEQLGRQ